MALSVAILLFMDLMALAFAADMGAMLTTGTGTDLGAAFAGLGAWVRINAAVIL